MMWSVNSELKVIFVLYANQFRDKTKIFFFRSFCSFLHRNKKETPMGVLFSNLCCVCAYHPLKYPNLTA